MEVDSEAVADNSSSLQAKLVPMESAWKCFCSDPGQAISSPQNESISRCMISSLQSASIQISLSINSGSFNESLAFDSDVLQWMMMNLLSGNISFEDKQEIINLLNKHRQLHPGCCSTLNETYRTFITKPMTEFNGKTILEKILQDIEDTLLKDDKSCLNVRMSRTSRRKKKSDDFYNEEDLQNMSGRRSSARSRSTIEEVPEVDENDEKNPFFRFAALNFIVEIISHEFYSRCYQSENKDAHRKSIAGEIFLQFVDSEVTLNEDIVNRILDLYHCDVTDVLSRKTLETIIELISNLCLFSDSGSLVVTKDITSSKDYKLAFLFCQYFIQNVFKRASPAEMNKIMKDVRPEWLRLNCAFNCLKRYGSSKTLSSIVDKLGEVVCGENSDPDSTEMKLEIDEKNLKKIFEKRLNEDTALILLNLFHSFLVVYDLRENKKRSDNFMKNEIYMNYLKFKKIVEKLKIFDKCPEYFIILLYV